MNKLLFSLFAVLVTANQLSALDNGLARTPPMGWISWTRFTCEIDCDQYPNDCIHEKLYMDMADRMAEDGYKELGYEYVNVDDCWPLKERDPKTGELVPDPKRFPSGIKALADYVHSKGLKLGIYGDMGTSTCAGYPGYLTEVDGTGKNYFQIDSDTFAAWEVDMVKVDGCFADSRNFSFGFPALGKAIEKAGRPMLYSCEWPFYQVQDYHIDPDYEPIAQTCNMWRNQHDVDDSWANVVSIIDYYGDNYDKFAKYNRPGAWFDPDMLTIGNFGLSFIECQAQMAIWSILAVPLFMSNDLRKVPKEYKEILQNRHLIEVNQDAMGLMGQRILAKGEAGSSPVDMIEVWRKPVAPLIDDTYHSFAIVYFNRYNIGTEKNITRRLKDILKGHKTPATGYKVLDLYDDAREIGQVSIDGNLTLTVTPSGGVRFVKLVPLLTNLG